MNQAIKVLIVDDDPDLLFATSRIVKSAGYDVVTASTGSDCIEKARKTRPDLILLDVILPDIEGPEVCRQIKADPIFEDTIVILMSGMRTSSAEQAEGLNLGSDGYIARPISNEELKARLNAFVRILIAQRKRAYEQLKSYANELKEKNIALNVLLENRQEDKKKTANLILDNFNTMVFPYIERLKQSDSKEDTWTISNIIEINMQESLFPLEKSFSSVYRKFTPMEIQVADLIKAGKTSKEISKIMNVSLRTISFHRDNIRKKLSINKEKVNLRTFLHTLS